MKDKRLQSEFNSSRQRHGLTLVEVISVAVIVGLLIGILIPTIYRIRAVSEGAACQSNLRQLGVAALMFISDNNGELPHNQMANSRTDDKRPGIREYLLQDQTSNVGQDTVFTCPTLQRGPYPSGSSFNRTYSVNGHMFSEGNLDVDMRTYGTVSNMRDVLNPSEAALYMDGRHGGKVSVGTGYSYAGYVRSAQWLKQEAMLQFPHRNKQNVVFLDGRVAALLWEEAPYRLSNEPFWSGGGSLSSRPR